MNNQQTCPRRMQEIGPWEHKTNLDTWETVGNDRCCSFCGSMHPEDFERVCELAISDDTTRIEQSTKSYKVYIHRDGIRNAKEGAIKYYKAHNYTDENDIRRIEPKFIEAIKVSKQKFDRIMEATRKRYE